MLSRLKKKIETKKAKIGIVGLGYVGLPLAIEFAKAGFDVVGIDIDKQRVQDINRGKSYITDIKDTDLKSVLRKKRFHAASDFKIVKKLDTIIICVPTPLRKTKEPDISFIIDASKKVSEHLSKGSLVILQSTTYPGTTEEKLLQIFQTRGRKIDKDFYLAFSPERVDPGNERFTTVNTPKIIGGLSKSSSEVARVLYEKIIDVVVVVSSAKTAEIVKLLENSFRSVNIALVNELAIICNKLEVNVWEVVEAAKTKPFGFMPFYPGPGLGGHCIPVDPLYLTWKARLEGLEPRFIELASQVNSYMPQYVVERLNAILDERKKSLKGSKVLIIGITYKKDVNDTRESPAIEVIKLLKEKKANIHYHDPYVPRVDINNWRLASTKLSPKVLKSFDCVAIVTDHTNIDYKMVAKNSKVVFDTRNAVKANPGRNIIKL